MNKFKKLLSVLMAAIMVFSCFAVLGSAYQDYEDPDAYFYDSNDNPRSYLYTDEQRFSFLADTVNGLLADLNIRVEQSILIDTIVLDARSLDALFDSFDDLSGYLKYLGGLLGDLGDLDFSRLMDASISVYNTNGAQQVFTTLVDFLGDNADKLGDIIESGTLDLGLIGNFVDISAVGDILGDLPGLIGGLIYGLGTRKLTNGIGDDPEYPNSTLWDDLASGDKPNFDTMVQNLLFKLLTEPNNTEKTNDPTRNLIITNPEAYGATAAMIHQDEYGYYYIYGTQKNGKWIFTENTTTTDDSDKNYISQWKDDSALVDGAAGEQLREIINLTEGDLYTMLEKAIPWAYDTFAGHNLDGQLRATLMQFCGAFNSGNVDEATKEQLTTIVNGYKEMEDNADKDKSVLRDEFAATQGVAGNYNFMYIDLEGKEIGDKTSDSLYYVVEWGNSWQYYHVEYGEDGKNVNALFDLIDWEYQAPMWETIASEAGVVAGQSFLLHINDIVGAILKRAMPSLQWTAGTADNTLANNITALAKLVINNAKGEIWGDLYELPADLDSYTLEQLLVLIAGELLELLMPQLVLPADVTSVEEVGAYALREFMAEIMPHLGAGWDAMFTDAKALSGTAREDAFLNIVLNMGVSTGAYYLQNLIGLGTKTDGANTTSVEAVPMGADYTWQEILSYIIDWVVATFVPNLTSKIDLSSTNPLDKLSAVFSTLAPSLVKVLGATTDSYALDLNHVYDDLRLAFNGDFSELAKGLQRKTSGTSANMTAMGALATLLTELFGGLGMNTHSRWSELKGVMDNAAASATPLTTLIGTYGDNTNLAKLIRPFIACLAGTRTIWLYDGVKIILHFIGGLNSELKSNGLTIDGVLPAYTGATSYTVEYSFELTTSGVRTYFNNGRYKTTAGALAGQQTGFDGDYSMKFYEVRVIDEDGNVKASQNYNGAEVAANEAANGSLTFDGVTEKIEIYTLEQDYTIVGPDGSEGEQTTYRSSFIVTSLKNDSLTKSRVETEAYTEGSDGTAWQVSAGSGCNTYQINYTGKWAFNWTNIYISEVESLTKAANPVLSMSDLSSEAHSTGGEWKGYHTYSKAWVASYGTNTYNDDGSITITSDGGAENIIINDGATTVHDVWFKWAGNENALNQKAVTIPTSQVGATYTGSVTYNETGADIPMWAIETTVVRSDFEADYTSYKIQVPLSAHGDMTDEKNGAPLDTSAMDRTNVATITQYITLYNSYDLLAKLEAALAVDKADYDTTATEWTAFRAAIDYANTQMYGQWQATQFQANHTINVASLPTAIPKDAEGVDCEGYDGTTVSTFKYAGDRLEEAMLALENCKLEADDSADEETVIAPSNPSSDLYPVYQALKTVDDKGYKNNNYVLYRWFKFSDNREAIRTALNAATPPSGVANDTLIGVDLDNEGIQGVIDAIGNDALEAIVELLVEHPTQEAIDAAAQALADFAPVYDVTELMIQVQKMQTAEKRLVPKYDSQQKYFLNDAITKYGNESAAAYTAESYEVYADALAAAQAANTSSTATQYEIFSARYEFLVAYNDLILADEAVDLTNIMATVEVARDILSKLGTDEAYSIANEEITEEEAYKQLVLALGYEVTYDDVAYMIGGGNTAEVALKLEGLYTKVQKQAIVDSIDESLVAAVANFELAASEPSTLMVKEDFEYADYVVIDTENTNNGEYTGIVYGIDTLDQNMYLEALATLADALTTNNGDDYLVIEANDQGVESTGATITVIDENGDALETYVFVYFGDVDGDGMITGSDAYIASEYEITYEGIESYASYVAGDVDVDGMVAGGDGYIMSEYEILYEGVDYQYNLAMAVVENGYVYEWIY